MHGKFVISLDFELFWGVRDKKTYSSYGKNILGVQKVLPRLLETFKVHKIKATFATIGMIFFENKIELLEHLPTLKPNYENKSLSPYLGYVNHIGESNYPTVFHFAPNLIKQIINFHGNEIGTHTFSHFYCLEKGQNIDDFTADLMSAKKIAEKFNINLTSLVFPRNQINNEYLKICEELGIICFRGKEKSWLYNKPMGLTESKIGRILRFLDAYINISGHNCYTDEFIRSNYPIDIPSSRFLRPFEPKLKFLDNLRLRRITTGMTYAAKKGLTYHLWWHPHNFGLNQEENFVFLQRILNHYTNLNIRYNFQNYTMSGLAIRLTNEK